MFFAFRKYPDLISRTRTIADGTGLPDMVQDLSDQSVLGKEHSAHLKKIGVDLNLLDKASELSGQLADLMAIARGDRSIYPEAKKIRDQAYTLVKKDVDEIRETGQYVFWRTPERAKGYASEYFRRH